MDIEEEFTGGNIKKYGKIIASCKTFEKHISAE